MPYAPEAAPASAVGTVASATSTSGTTSRPSPIPDSASAGTRSHVDRPSALPWTVASTHAVDTDWSAAPANITILPSLVPSGIEIAVPTNAPTLNGSSVMPAWIADQPSPVCTYTVSTRAKPASEPWNAPWVTRPAEKPRSANSRMGRSAAPLLRSRPTC